MRLAPSTSPKIPLRAVLVVPFVLQIFLAVGITGWLSFRNGQTAVNDVATQLRSEITARVKQYLETYLATPHLINQINADDIPLEQLNTPDTSALEQTLWKRIQQFPHVSTIMFGNEALEYVSGVTRIRGTQVIPKVQIFASDPLDKHQLYFFSADRQGKRLNRLRTVRQLGVRSRPWYQAGASAKKPIWSPIFKLTTGDEWAINASHPIYHPNSNQLVGVFSVTLSLSHISNFLQGIQVGKSGQVFIIENSGSMVADSTGQSLLIDQKTSTVKHEAAINSPNPLIRDAIHCLISTYGNFNKIPSDQKLEFKGKNSSIFLQTLRYQDRYGLDWLIIVALPESDFIEQINANTRTTLFLCLLALVAATGLGVLTSLWISKPIHHLIQANRAIAVGDFEQKVPDSPVEEIGALAISFQEMSRQLQQSYAQLADYSHSLEQKVTERTQALKQEIQEHKQTELELKQAKQKAEVASKAKSEFLANMSHELRTPLNGILGYAQILMRSPTLQETDRNSISIIQKCGSHLLTLINDILDFSKIEAQKLELLPTEFSLFSLLQSVGEICQINAQQKDIDFICQFDPKLFLNVQADEKRLRQVLFNLIGNAVKFTDTGTVTFKVGIVRAIALNFTATSMNTVLKIRFQIEDTGIGMTDEQIQKLFAPFEQVGDLQRKAQGTGLGLAISQKIVELMGSKIKVTSQLGVGSQFWFDLDLPSSSLGEIKLFENFRGKIIGFVGDKRKILVVDDRWENRSVILNLLAPIGFEIAEAVNGVEALQLVPQFQPDLIVSDLVMPEMDGFQLLHQLGSQPETKHIKVIVSSASVFETDRHQSLAAGADAFLSKPIQASELFELLQKHLNLSWIYEDLPPIFPRYQVESESENQLSVPSEVLLPSREVLERFYDLVMKGNLKEIVRQAEQLKEQDSQFIPFADQICDLAKAFREKQLRVLISEYRGS